MRAILRDTCTVLASVAGAMLVMAVLAFVLGVPDPHTVTDPELIRHLRPRF
jgi:hypothetical protein